MNKINTSLVSIVAGVDYAFNLATPLLIAGLCIRLFNLDVTSTIIFFSAGAVSTIFRGLKIWFKKW